MFETKKENKMENKRKQKGKKETFQSERWDDEKVVFKCFQTYRQEGYAREAEEICIGALSS